MKVGIIEAGRPPSALVPEFGTYVSMTQRLLGEQHDYTTFRAPDGEWPRRGACDAFVVTGSACGVNDGLPWIDRLADFLRAVRFDVKLVGICFGHQVMAHAFGGTVERARQGWGLGLHRYEVLERAPWMDDVEAVFATASHQDQVVTTPARSRILAASAFTPHAVLDYQDHPAMSVQFHPEFDPAFSRALLAARRAPDLREDDIRRAVDSLSAANDNARIGRWISGFLASHA